MFFITRIILISFLVLLTTCSNENDYIKISVEEYHNKVYASWLGQCVGNIYGLPHENAYIDVPGPDEFPYGYGRNAERLKEINGAFSDDDTDIEYMYLLAMEKYGIEPKLEELAESWKYHVRDRVWLANRAALAAMHYGYTPPFTGSKSLNPHWFQIDPQLVNEIWGVTSPGMIKYASEKSGWAASIMCDDWGIDPTIFYGALYSAAFFETDINELLDIALNSLPAGSRYRETVMDMIILHKKYPDDWQRARTEMADKYYHNEPANTKTIWNANLNGACGILALLYGEGNFQNTLDLACAMGFDADNQAATLCGLLGIMNGKESIPAELLYPFENAGWKMPLNDIYRNVSRYDMPDGRLSDMAERTAKLGEEIISMHGGLKITESGIDYLLINPKAKFSIPLELPKGPLPVIEINKEVNYKFSVIGGTGNYSWKIISGNLPEGLIFQNGELKGKTSLPGVFPIVLQVFDVNESDTTEIRLMVRSENLASTAEEVLSNVQVVDKKLRDTFWLTVPKSLYAGSIDDIIRDGKYTGERSTFYSISKSKQQKDFYGYRWSDPVIIGSISLHTGSVEEMGGWFNSLEVEYLSNSGQWLKAEEVLVSPSLPKDKEGFIRPNFVEYVLTFKPIRTKGIRITGEPGGLEHWYNKEIYPFTSVTELSVYESPMNNKSK